ncbi:MAG: HEPN domain-containing protein [Candidatus Brocadiaceae bacterium]|nr:HEPN domain-containing protein [Candidatus Brocadiaceae bacterium]
MPVLDDVKEVVDIIKKEGTPDAIILFGSIAKGAEGKDIDLLIVGNKKEEKRIVKSLYPFFKKYPLDTFFVSKKKLKELYYHGSPFLRLIQKEGRLLYMHNSLKDWHGSVLEDFRQAKYLSEGGFYKGACFSCQQAIEKIITWALLKKGWELEKIHNIRRLIAIAENFGIMIKLDDEEIDYIDSVYKGRYPGEEGLLPLGSPTQKDAKRALKIAKKKLDIFKDSVNL